MTSISGSNVVIVDSDALIGLIHKDDALHDRCIKVAYYLSEHSIATIVPYPIVLEAATVLAKDKTVKRPDLAAQLLSDYSTIDQVQSDESEIGKLVATLYNPKTSRRNTPFDHYVLALAKIHRAAAVFSFDPFYRRMDMPLAWDLLKTTTST